MHYIAGAGLLDFGEVAPPLSLYVSLSIVLSLSLSLSLSCSLVLSLSLSPSLSLSFLSLSLSLSLALSLSFWLLAASIGRDTGRSRVSGAAVGSYTKR